MGYFTYGPPTGYRRATLDEQIEATDAYNAAADRLSHAIMWGGTDAEIRSAKIAKTKAGKRRDAINHLGVKL